MRPQGLLSTFVDLHDEVCGFCYKNSKFKQPSFDWTLVNGISTMGSYPSGVTRSVLLTELEQKWRSAVRRGENTSKLKRVLAQNQLPIHEILDGCLQRVGDDFRFKLVSDGASVDLILHQQTSDFITHCKNLAFEAFHDRRVRLTQCRLNVNPTMLLPTPLLSLVLEMGKVDDVRLITEVLLPSYAKFISLPCAEQEIQATYRSVFATILTIGPPTQHPSTSGYYRVIRLRLCPQQMPFQSTLLSSSQVHSGVDTGRIVYLILLEDKVGLSELWSEQETIFLFRPYVENNSEEALFGSRVCFADAPLEHDVVVRPDRLLEGASSDPRVLPVHLLVSAVTVCGVVLSNEKIVTPQVPPNSGPTRLHHFLQDTLTAPFAQIARLDREEAAAGSTLERFLWMETDSESGKTVLIRVRCPTHLLCKERLPGQVFLLEGLVAEGLDAGKENEHVDTSSGGQQPYLRLVLSSSMSNVSRLPSLLCSSSVFTPATSFGELSLFRGCSLVRARVSAICPKPGSHVITLCDDSGAQLGAHFDELCINLSTYLPAFVDVADVDDTTSIVTSLEKGASRWQQREFVFLITSSDNGLGARIECVSDMRSDAVQDFETSDNKRQKT